MIKLAEWLNQNAYTAPEMEILAATTTLAQQVMADPEVAAALLAPYQTALLMLLSMAFTQSYVTPDMELRRRWPSA